MCKRLPKLDMVIYELRLLQVPALKFLAIWLHSDTQPPDLLVPIVSIDERLSAGKAYHSDEVLATLKPRAEALLGSDDGRRVS
jgi:hypothetical protein